MKFSVMLSSGLLVLVGAVLLVEAGYGMGGGAGTGYDPIPAYGGGSYGSAMSSYGGGCSGYSCAGMAPAPAPAPAKKSYGAYVRPVIYGGRGMYSYKGYARQPAGPKKHSRYARSCSGYNCGSSGYRKQSMMGYSAPAPSYAQMAPMRPVYAPAMKSYGARAIQYSDAPARSYGAY